MGSEGEERLGELVGGRYELRAVLGHGGQSVIYRAKDQVDGDEVALKMLKQLGDKDAVDRLFREARALVALSGTAALRVLHQTVANDGSACLVTELLRGQDLTGHLSDIESSGERMPRHEIVQTFEPIVHTLEAAHAQGIIHRDIKPENIFLIHPAYGGGVRLLDFGFSRFMDLKRLTAPGMVADSPLYLAPELWSGKDVDSRVDVYSLAVLLYRVIGGKVPFSGAIHELLQLVRRAPRPSLHALRPDLPEDIDAWVASALAVDPNERFQKPRALWNALLQCLP